MKKLSHLFALIILSTAAPLCGMQKGRIVDRLNEGIAPAQIAYKMGITPHETPDLWDFLHKKVEERSSKILQIHLKNGLGRLTAVLQTSLDCKIYDQALDTNRLQQFITDESLKMLHLCLQHRQSIPLQRRYTTGSRELPAPPTTEISGRSCCLDICSTLYSTLGCVLFLALVKYVAN